jgi:hypothetical protein
VDVCRRLAETLKNELGIDHATVQPEAPPPDDIVSVRTSRDGAPVRRVG